MSEAQYAEIANFAFTTGKLGDEQVLSLRVWTSGTQHEFLLGSVENGQGIADEFYKNLIAAVREGKRAKTGLVVVNGGVNDAALRRPPRGKQARPKHPGKEGA